MESDDRSIPQGPTPTQALRREVVRRQRELGWHDAQMADQIGIPRTTYNTIKTGRYRISLFHAQQIVAAFPDLAPHALALIQEPDPGDA